MVSENGGEIKFDEIPKKTSKVIVLDGGAEQSELGYHYTTEDIVALISGLSDLTTVGGGYLGIGAFHNLDIALDRQADSIVLMDIDEEIVDLNRQILQIVEDTDQFEDLLPNIRRFIEEQDVMPLDFFDKYISSGTNLRCRTPLTWAKSFESFSRLKQLISNEKVAVAHSDITDPRTMQVIGRFFTRSGNHLQYVNLSNVENPGYELDDDDLKLLGNIPTSLYNAGGVPSTLIISSFEARKDIPGTHIDQVTVLQPKVNPIPKSESMFTFEFKYLVRSLGALSNTGIMNVPSKNDATDS